MSETEQWCYGNDDGYRGPVESREAAIRAAYEHDDCTHVAKVAPITWTELTDRLAWVIWDHVMDELVERVGDEVVSDNYEQTPAPDFREALCTAIATTFEKHLGPVKVFGVRDPEELPDDEGVTS